MPRQKRYLAQEFLQVQLGHGLLSNSSSAKSIHFAIARHDLFKLLTVVSRIPLPKMLQAIRLVIQDVATRPLSTNSNYLGA